MIDSASDPFVDISGAYNYELDNHLVAYGYETASGSSIRVAIIGDSSEVGGSNISMDSDKETVEEGDSVTLAVERSGDDLSYAVSVNYTTSDGTADSNDYTPKSGTLTFGSGGSQLSLLTLIQQMTLRLRLIIPLLFPYIIQQVVRRLLHQLKRLLLLMIMMLSQ